MIFIKNIEIERFRSCRRTIVTGLTSYAIMCGKNNSGKSNILRALSLFFKNEIEPGIPLNLSSDCNAAAKEKKRISITIEFAIPDNVKIQNTIKHVLDIVPRSAKIKKSFELDPYSLSGYSIKYFVNDSEVSVENRIYVEQFLSLFNFRYITASRTPGEVLAKNLSELRSELNFRISHKFRAKTKNEEELKKFQESVLDSVKKLTGELFIPIKNEMIKADSDIVDVSISAPNDLTQLLNAAVYKVITKSGTILNETFQGQGIQNLLLFTVLYLIDRNFHRKFGWKIATIWAIEEPEIFLHFGLENQLSQYFYDISEKYQERFQLFLTSHSSVFPQFATSHFFVSRAQTSLSWTIVEKQNITSYMKTLVTSKITNFPNLLTYFPNRQIILTEGDIDEYIIGKLAEVIGLKNTIIFSVAKFIGEKRGGDSRLYNFIMSNAHVLNSRTKGCGVIAIFDWDFEKTKAINLSRHISSPNYVFQFDEKFGNPLLDKSFKGIERFYDTEIIEWLSESEGNLIMDRGSANFTSRFYADPARYFLIKQKLFERIKEKNLNFTYFSELKNTLNNIESKNPEIHLPL